LGIRLISDGIQFVLYLLTDEGCNHNSADPGAQTEMFLPGSRHQAVCPDTPHRQQNHQELGDFHHSGNQIQSLLVHSQFLVCVPRGLNQEL